MRNRLLVKHHRSCAEKAEILAAYQRRGLTQREVAAEYHIAVSTLQRWQRVLQDGQDRGTKQLIEVPNLLGSPGAGVPYRLRFPRGLVLEVAAGFEPGEVRTLAELLQSL